MNGDWLAVDAPGVPHIVVFHRDDLGTPGDVSDDLWNFHSTLAQGLLYGRSSLAIDADRLAIGSHRGEEGPGRAYIYEWDGNTWTGPEIIMPNDPEAGDFFGVKVDLSGEFLASAASRDTYACAEGGQCRGSSYVFRRVKESWVQDLKVIGGSLGESAGGPVAVCDGQVAVGGHLATGAAGTNIVHVFQFIKETWINERQFDLGAEYFGYDYAASLAFRNDILLIGAPRPDRFARCFLHRPVGEFGETQILTPPLNTEQYLGQMGQTVALDGDWAAASGAGPVFVFRICEDCGTLHEFARLQNGFQLQNCAALDFNDDGLCNLTDLEAFVGVMKGP
jgi:hypothetical protein